MGGIPSRKIGLLVPDPSNDRMEIGTSIAVYSKAMYMAAVVHLQMT